MRRLSCSLLMLLAAIGAPASAQFTPLFDHEVRGVWVTNVDSEVLNSQKAKAPPSGGEQVGPQMAKAALAHGH